MWFPCSGMKQKEIIERQDVPLSIKLMSTESYDGKARMDISFQACNAEQVDVDQNREHSLHNMKLTPDQILVQSTCAQILTLNELTLDKPDKDEDGDNNLTNRSTAS